MGCSEGAGGVGPGRVLRGKLRNQGCEGGLGALEGLYGLGY